MASESIAHSAFGLFFQRKNFFYITNTLKKRTRIFQMREHIRLIENYYYILRIKLA